MNENEKIAKKIYVSADDFLRDSWRLAASVRAGAWRPDALLALWRGGATPGVALHEFLKVTDWDLAHYPLKCSSYSALDQQASHVTFSCSTEIFEQLKRHQRVLIVDDVFDTGLTAQEVKAELSARGIDTKIACVYWKSPRNKTTIKPDYFVRDTGNEWLVFPHEIDGLTAAEIREKDPLLATLLPH